MVPSAIQRALRPGSAWSRRFFQVATGRRETSEGSTVGRAEGCVSAADGVYHRIAGDPEAVGAGVRGEGAMGETGVVLEDDEELRYFNA